MSFCSQGESASGHVGIPTPPPPEAVHAGRYGQHAGGTDPTGMHSCLNSCCYVLGVDDLYFNSVFTCNVSVITTAI